MYVSKIYNATLLQIIAQEGEITYTDLKEKYCVPMPHRVVSSRDVMFDSDLKTLETEGYIKRTGELIVYLGR